MKIDFTGSFKEISRLFKSAPQSIPSPTSNTEFEQVIGDLSGAKNSGQPIKSTKIGVESTGLSRGSDRSMRARFAFGEPPLIVPSPERVGPTHPPSESSTTSVKIPTLIEGRRISADRGGAIAAATTPRREEITQLVNSAGEKHGLDPTLGLAVLSAESSFNPAAVSADGHASKGLFQLLDSTGHTLHERAGLKESYDPFDPAQNVDLGVGYLRYLHDLFSRSGELSNSLKVHAAANSSSLEKLAVAAFNAGEGRVAAAQMRASRDGKDPSNYGEIAPYLPESTQQYVTKVLASRQRLEDESGEWGEG